MTNVLSALHPLFTNLSLFQQYVAAEVRCFVQSNIYPSGIPLTSDQKIRLHPNLDRSRQLCHGRRMAP